MADHLDPNLVNPWGIAASSTSRFWIVNNHSGLATVYDSTGKAAPLVVTVPTGSGPGPSPVTGQVFNGSSAFVLQGAKPALFLFCSEDGTISGWYNGIENNKAVVAVNRSGSGAVYKGLALGTSDAGPVLYAATSARAPSMCSVETSPHGRWQEHSPTRRFPPASLPSMFTQSV